MDLNIYCDESCHLLRDPHAIMVLGAVTCPKELTRKVSLDLKKIKTDFGIGASTEIKWNKVSNGNAAFYKAIADYFFNSEFLTFRCVVTPKNRLDHQKFGHDHDTWYFKMYFLLLRRMIDSKNTYQIFLDVKDTKSQKKTKNLHHYLCNDQYDFDHQIIKRIETVRSHDTPCLQITDLLIGCMSYVNRGLIDNFGKLEVVEHIRKRSGKALTKQTLVGDSKFNIFMWEPS